MKLLRGVGLIRVKYQQGTTDTMLTLATCKEVNLGITAEDARQNAGDKLFPLDIFTHTKGGRIRITDASLNMEVLELMGAGSPGSSENMLVNELLDVSGGQVTTNAAYVTGSISILNAAGSPVTGFSEDAGLQIITGLSAYNGEKLKVYYETAACTGMTVNSLKVNDEPIYFELVHSSRYRDPATNDICLFQTRVYRCRLVGNLEFTNTHGEFSAPVIEAEILDPQRSDNKVITYAFGVEPADLVH